LKNKYSLRVWQIWVCHDDLYSGLRDIAIIHSVVFLGFWWLLLRLGKTWHPTRNQCMFDHR
jgi:hypothetical protein